MPKPAFTTRELADLYEELAPQLLRIVHRNLTAPDGVVEDACQGAWRSLLENRDGVARGSELGWLSTTATREVLHQLRARRREVSYEEQTERGDLAERSDPAPGPQRLAELHERLAEIHELPSRQERMIWMQGFGYCYREISDLTGDSLRTVERQLLRARSRLARPA